jgi:hypothetical protein
VVPVDDLGVAVALARQAVGAPDDLPADAVRVRRLDRDDEYVLVRLGAPGDPGWIAAVNVAAADVMSWAANPSGEPTWPPVPTTGAAPEYVWTPSALSRSPLYPLLRIATADGERYVDLAGRAHEALGDARG